MTDRELLREAVEALKPIRAALKNMRDANAMIAQQEIHVKNGKAAKIDGIAASCRKAGANIFEARATLAKIEAHLKGSENE